jgi:hypothetical protein
VDDPQPQQTLAHFLGDHRGAAIAQQRPVITLIILLLARAERF